MGASARAARRTVTSRVPNANSSTWATRTHHVGQANTSARSSNAAGMVSAARNMAIIAANIVIRTRSSVVSRESVSHA